MALCLKVIQLENYKGINYVQQDLQYSKLKKLTIIVKIIVVIIRDFKVEN